VGFLFAPQHHSAMKHAIGPRKEMGVRTLFNLLGPLTNPAGAPNQVLGVFSEHWVEPLARVLQHLGSEHVLVVHAEDGLDEISIGSPTRVAELKDGGITVYTVAPEDFGLERADLSAVAVADAGQSLAMISEVLDNRPGPARDIVMLNAGAAIYAAGVADSLVAESSTRFARMSTVGGTPLGGAKSSETRRSVPSLRSRETVGAVSTRRVVGVGSCGLDSKLEIEIDASSERTACLTRASRLIRSSSRSTSASRSRSGSWNSTRTETLSRVVGVSFPSERAGSVRAARRPPAHGLASRNESGCCATSWGAQPPGRHPPELTPVIYLPDADHPSARPNLLHWP